MYLNNIPIVVACMLCSLMAVNAADSVSTESEQAQLEALNQSVSKATKSILEQIPDLSEEQEEPMILETAKLVMEYKVSRAKMMKAREQGLSRKAMREAREVMVDSRRKHLKTIEGILSKEQFDAFSSVIESEMPSARGRDAKNEGGRARGDRGCEDS